MSLCLTLNQSSFTYYTGIETDNTKGHAGSVIKVIDKSQINLKDEIFNSFFRSLNETQLFESNVCVFILSYPQIVIIVYLSTCPSNTLEFIVSGCRPDCWHFVDLFESSICLRISSLVSDTCTFITPLSNSDLPIRLHGPLNDDLVLII